MVDPIDPPFNIEDHGGEAMHYPGCSLFFGPVPITAFGPISEIYPEGIIDTDLARIAGATLAMGTPEGCNAVKKSLLPAYLKRVRKHYQGERLSKAALDWLASGEQGSSAQALFHHLTGTQPIEGSVPDSHPNDPADFRRCRLLLDQVPELSSRLDEMAEVSPQWEALVARWGALCSTMQKECPRWREGVGQAPQLHDLIKIILDRVDRRTCCA